MTSKISFFKLMKEDLKRKLWLLVVAVLVFFISFPVALMISINNIENYYGLSEGRVKMQIEDAFAFLIGYENYWMAVVTVVGAVLCGIFAFSYLYKKKKVDFYHSIPVRREKLFLVSYLNGLLIYLIPYLLMLLICVLIGSRYITIRPVLGRRMLQQFSIQVLFYLLFYHITILATVLAGNMFGCFFLNGIAQFYMIFVYSIFTGYSEIYFTTYTSIGKNFYQSLAGLSPMVAFIGVLQHLLGSDGIYQLRLSAGEVSMKLYLMQCLLVVILIFGLALYLYRIRSSEMSGKAIAFRKIQPVLRILIVIPCALAGGWIFGTLTDFQEVGWMLFGILFAAVLVHGVIEVLYQSDIRGIFSHRIQLAGTVVAAIVAAVIFRKDLFGYDTYLPKMEKIESAAVYIDGITTERSIALATLDGYSYYVSSMEYAMEKMKLTKANESLPVVYQLMCLGVETIQTKEQIDNWAEFYIRVRLKSGKEVMRRYTVSLDKAYDLLDNIFQSQEYKEKIYAGFLENSMRKKVAVRGLANQQELSEEDGERFLEIYKKELMALTLDDIRENPVIGMISYQVQEGRSGSYRDRELQLYSGMEESMAYLEQIGILEQDLFWAQPKAEDLVAVRMGMYYDEMTSYRDSYEWKRVETTDPEQMQKLCENLYFSPSWDRRSLFWRVRDDYHMEVVLNPEISQKYFGVEKERVEVVFLSSDQEMASWVERLIVEGEAVE